MAVRMDARLAGREGAMRDATIAAAFPSVRYCQVQDIDELTFRIKESEIVVGQPGCVFFLGARTAVDTLVLCAWRFSGRSTAWPAGEKNDISHVKRTAVGASWPCHRARVAVDTPCGVPEPRQFSRGLRWGGQHEQK